MMLLDSWSFHRGRTTIPRSVPVVFKSKTLVAACLLNAFFKLDIWYEVLMHFRARKLRSSKRTGDTQGQVAMKAKMQ